MNQFATAARVVHDSDLLSVLPRSFVAASGLADGLVVRPVPFDLPRIEVGMLWHRRHERDPAQRWLRETVEEVVKGLGIGEPRGRVPAPRREAVADAGLSARRARARESGAQREGAAMAWFEGFESGLHPVGDVELFARIGGDRSKPPLLLLHGYPADARDVAPRRARARAPTSALVIPDLRGYGDSTKPAPAATPELDHAQHSKRAMAADMVALMRSLGHERFAVVGHDRGGRVAHRLALDHPERVERLAVIDIVPTLDMYDATDMRFASWYYHWFFLIQPAPLPERMIGGDPAFYLRWTLGAWGSARPRRSSSPRRSAEYERCFCRADTIHAACEDYRASASIDLEHDRASRAAGEKIACDDARAVGRRAASSAASTIRSRSGARSARRRSRARRWRPATSSPKSCPTRPPRSSRLPAPR